MRQLQKCCCCSVRTGANIIAILGLVFAGFGLFGNVVTYISEDSVFNDFQAQQEQLRQLYLNGQISEDDYKTYVNYVSRWKQYLPVTLGIGITTSLFQGAITALLLVGIIKNKHSLMLPYLIVEMIGIVVSALGLVIGTIVLFAFGQILAGFLVLLIGSPLVFLSFYFWWVVQSEYLNIKDVATGSPVHKPIYP